MLVVIAMAAATMPVASAQTNGVIRLDFEKELVGANVWSGSVDPDGSIRTILTDVRETGSVWHVTFQWHVFEVATPFDAVVTGVLNLETGGVALNGRVDGGEFDGSHIGVKAQLDLNDFSSEGTMTITP